MEALLAAAHWSTLLVCTVIKLPQLAAVLAARSARGVSLESLVLELSGRLSSLTNANGRGASPAHDGTHHTGGCAGERAPDSVADVTRPCDGVPRTDTWAQLATGPAARISSWASGPAVWHVVAGEHPLQAAGPSAGKDRPAPQDPRECWAIPQDRPQIPNNALKGSQLGAEGDGQWRSATSFARPVLQ
ncbi:unnamed protein product [Lepidochelys olivacea]